MLNREQILPGEILFGWNTEHLFSLIKTTETAVSFFVQQSDANLNIRWLWEKMFYVLQSKQAFYLLSIWGSVSDFYAAFILNKLWFIPFLSFETVLPFLV